MRAVFAENLVRARTNAGVSQREAAAALGVSQSLLSHYEKGIREPGLDFVCRAATYYNITTDALLGQPIKNTNFSDPTPCPSRFGRTVARELQDTLSILLDLLSRNYDPSVYCYATLYLSEAIYEVIRQFARMAPDYDSETYQLSEDGFLAGAVTSDLNWVRSRYIMATRDYVDRNGMLPEADRDGILANYGNAFSSAVNLVRRIGQRVDRLSCAEVSRSDHLFEDVETLLQSKEDKHK